MRVIRACSHSTQWPTIKRIPCRPMRLSTPSRSAAPCYPTKRSLLRECPLFLDITSPPLPDNPQCAYALGSLTQENGGAWIRTGTNNCRQMMGVMSCVSAIDGQFHGRCPAQSNLQQLVDFQLAYLHRVFHFAVRGFRPCCYNYTLR